MSAWTLVSRLLGLVRDVVITALLGVGAHLDVFLVMLKIPNFFRRVFAEGAFAQAFVPVLGQYRERGDSAAVRGLLDATAGALSLVLMGLTLLALLAAPAVVALFAPGFVGDPVKFPLAVDVLRLMFPYLFFISLVALAAGILNSYGRFAVPALTPVFFNLSLIVAALVVAPFLELPVQALAVGVLAAGLIQLLLQVGPLARLGLLPRPRLDLKHPGLARVMTLMVPGLIAGGASQFNLLVDTVLASLLVTGSPTWLYLSDRLVQLPLGIFAIALGTVLLPDLSRRHSRGARDEFHRSLDWGVRMNILIGAPSVIGLILLAEPLVATLFQHGAFTAADTRMTAASLVAFAVGLPGFMLIKVLVPGYFARQDTATPVRIALLAMVANLGLNLWLAFGLDMGHTGLALASSLASYLSVGLLLGGLLRGGHFRFQPGWGEFLVRLALANCLLAVLVPALTPAWEVWQDWGFIHRVLALAGILCSGVAAYGAALWLLGLFDNWRELQRP